MCIFPAGGCFDGHVGELVSVCVIGNITSGAGHPATLRWFVPLNQRPFAWSLVFVIPVLRLGTCVHGSRGWEHELTKAAAKQKHVCSGAVPRF